MHDSGIILSQTEQYDWMGYFFLSQNKQICTLRIGKRNWETHHRIVSQLNNDFEYRFDLLLSSYFPYNKNCYKWCSSGIWAFYPYKHVLLLYVALQQTLGIFISGFCYLVAETSTYPMAFCFVRIEDTNTSIYTRICEQHIVMHPNRGRAPNLFPLHFPVCRFLFGRSVS